MIKCPVCHDDDMTKYDHIVVSELIDIYKGISDVQRLLDGVDDIGYFKCNNCDLNYFYPAITGDDKFYGELQNNDWYYLDEKEEYNYVAQYIPPESKVLEIGSGAGAFSGYLDRCEYTGLEFSNKAIETAKTNNINLINKTIQEYSNKYKNYYDVVCSFQVLEHVADAHSFIKSAITATKENGLFIVSVPSEDSFLKHAVNNCLNLPPHHVTRWSDNTLINLPKIFNNIELIKIRHESVQSIHLTWYLNTFISSLLLKPKLIDLSIKRKLINYFSKLITKLIMNRTDSVFLANGHTVTAIYKRIK